MKRTGSAGAALPALLALALSACSSQGPTPKVAEGKDLIECALGGAASFEKVCGVDRAKSQGILYLTVRHPDGSFRRFMVLEDGRGLAVADGSIQAITRYVDGFAELAVEQDRYRFPVTVTHNAAPKS